MSNRRLTDEEREAERNFQFHEEQETQEPVAVVAVPTGKTNEEGLTAETGWYEGCGCPNC